MSRRHGPWVGRTCTSCGDTSCPTACPRYLGLGTQPPLPSWGKMLEEARLFMDRGPWLAVFPGLAIALTVLGFNFLGDGLRDYLDPRH